VKPGFSSDQELGVSRQEGFDALINLLSEATIDYLTGQIEAGVEVVQLFDSWAGILPEPALVRWVIEPTKRITAALKPCADSRAYRISHLARRSPSALRSDGIIGRHTHRKTQMPALQTSCTGALMRS
jgi:uroporphyrinogen-III decarboxylase